MIISSAKSVTGKQQWIEEVYWVHMVQVNSRGYRVREESAPVRAYSEDTAVDVFLNKVGFNYEDVKDMEFVFDHMGTTTMVETLGLIPEGTY